MCSSDLAPRNPDALYGRGSAHEALGDYRAALADFHSAAALAPDTIDYWYAKADLEFELGELGAALDSLAHILKLEPGNAAVWIDVAEISFEAELYEQSIDACEQALALGDRLPEALYFLVQALHATGRVEEALVAYKRYLVLAADGKDSEGQTLPDIPLFRRLRRQLEQEGG